MKHLGIATTEKKLKTLYVRIDDSIDSILERYSEQEGISKSEAARRGIKLLVSYLDNSEN